MVANNWRDVIERIKGCSRCEISKDNPQKVIGRGPLNPKYLFVGLNPGKEEMRQGNVFVGPSGKLLNKWIDHLGIEENEYAVTNLIKCGTSNESDLKGEEAKNCLPFLKEQLEMLKPQYVFLLGAKSAQFMLNTTIGITNLSGRMFQQGSLEGPIYIPIPHPAYWLRNGGEGWRKVIEQVGMDIDSDISSESFPSEIDSFQEITKIRFEAPKEEVVRENPYYTPLHVHTTYSVTDSATTIDTLVRGVKEMGFESLAITDHGTLGGWVEFQRECEKNKIKPLLGIEFYVADNYTNKNTERYHVVAIARNQEGIKSIFKLNDISHRDGFYYKPRILLEHLIENKEGLIVLSACTLGVVAKHIVDDRPAQAIWTAKHLKEHFGDNFYMELQPHDFDHQHKVNPEIIKISEDFNIKLVVTTDSHYLRQQDQKAHDAIKAISFRKKMGEAGFSINTNYIMNRDDLVNKFVSMGVQKSTVLRAMKNTLEVAKKCNARLERHQNALPSYRSVES
ncbi:MAG: PHP domain-containing protein [Methanobacteriaceae archaeon]|nr:PHP domain-containing protein [Methanobacteriaceae archaeon]